MNTLLLCYVTVITAVVNGAGDVVTGHVSGRRGLGHGSGTWGRRLAASGVVLTTITLPHASFGPLKIAI